MTGEKSSHATRPASSGNRMTHKIFYNIRGFISRKKLNLIL
ncbi:hypothetical protein RBEAN4_0202 [Rickettsia bellii str. RML An4]|uniref:Uncharacterized protein n=1 Tax=Rickettsia bellii str. RML An4 TaxID=1359193 RepID=A0A0F3QAN5_RICBE|nr:hypothetical protein RBEAN4_0202 [Rickettsia bellii str. RML An4]